VENLAAVLACFVALLLGYVAGLRVPIAQPWIYLVGLVVGELCAFVYFTAANWVGRTWPGSLDARLIGVHLMILIVAAGLCGVIGSWFGYRKTIGRGLFR
jgi:hypothetical protein